MLTAEVRDHRGPVALAALITFWAPTDTCSPTPISGRTDNRNAHKFQSLRVKTPAKQARILGWSPTMGKHCVGTSPPTRDLTPPT
ncbi:hypothetical protein L209DRAFT_755307 [Thermothelomyces heterothallicus CBS 203.75]